MKFPLIKGCKSACGGGLGGCSNTENDEIIKMKSEKRKEIREKIKELR